MHFLQASQFFVILSAVSCAVANYRNQYFDYDYPQYRYKENYDYSAPGAEYQVYRAYGNPNYNDQRNNYYFDYFVNDPHSGDFKNQWETRNGDVVKGAYSLAEPDGTTRIVEYSADDVNGFKALVKRVGYALYPDPATRRHTSTTRTGYTQFS